MTDPIVDISYPITLREGAWQQDRALPVPIMLLAAGLSNGQKGRMRYAPEMLMREASKFEGIAVFDNHLSDQEYANKPYRSVKDKLGRVRNVRFDPTPVQPSAPNGGLVGSLHVLRETAPWFDELIHTHPEEVAFSIEARGPVKPLRETVGGRPCFDVVGFTKVISLDTVVEAGAGGQVLAFRETVSSEGDDEEHANMAELTAEQIAAIVQQAMQPITQQLTETRTELQQVRQQMTMRETTEQFFTRATARVNESTLPTVFKDAVMADFREAAAPASLEVGDQLIARRIEHYTKLLGSNAGAPQPQNGGSSNPNGGAPATATGAAGATGAATASPEQVIREAARTRVREQMDQRLGQVYIAGQPQAAPAAAGTASTAADAAAATTPPNASAVQDMLASRLGVA